MQFRLSSIAAIVATMAISTSANAALTTYAPWDNFFPASNGLDGVLFNVQTAGNVTVALGAHAYKNSVYLANNGVDTYYAQSGLYETERANWSFDFAWDLGTCTGCSVWLGVDIDPTAGVNIQMGDISGVPQPQSWNLEMGFLTAGYDFNPIRQVARPFGSKFAMLLALLWSVPTSP